MRFYPRKSRLEPFEMINEVQNEESEGSCSQKSSSDSFENPLDMNVVSSAELER